MRYISRVHAFFVVCFLLLLLLLSIQHSPSVQFKCADSIKRNKHQTGCQWHFTSKSFSVITIKTDVHHLTVAARDSRRCKPNLISARPTAIGRFRLHELECRCVSDGINKMLSSICFPIVSQEQKNVEFIAVAALRRRGKTFNFR